MCYLLDFLLAKFLCTSERCKIPGGKGVQFGSVLSPSIFPVFPKDLAMELKSACFMYARKDNKNNDPDANKAHSDSDTIKSERWTGDTPVAARNHGTRLCEVALGIA